MTAASTAPEVVALDKAEELVDALSRRAERWSPSPESWLFRGQSNAQWQLLPSALRGDTSLTHGPPRRGPFPTTSAQISVEMQVVMSFINLANEQALPIPGDAASVMDRLDDNWVRSDELLSQWDQFPPRELREVFALAQHHGVPTRLLDWTRNPLTAAYFAAIGAAERLRTSQEPRTREALGIWCLNHRALSVPAVGDERIELISLPRASNTNLHAQDGLFSLHIHPLEPEAPPLRAPLDQIVSGLAREPRAETGRGVLLLTLPVAESAQLLRLLTTEGVTAARLFPGYGGVVRTMREASVLLETWRTH